MKSGKMTKISIQDGGAHESTSGLIPAHYFYYALYVASGLGGDSRGQGQVRLSQSDVWPPIGPQMKYLVNVIELLG